MRTDAEIEAGARSLAKRDEYDDWDVIEPEIQGELLAASRSCLAAADAVAAPDVDPDMMLAFSAPMMQTTARITSVEPFDARKIADGGEAAPVDDIDKVRRIGAPGNLMIPVTVNLHDLMQVLSFLYDEHGHRMPHLVLYSYDRMIELAVEVAQQMDEKMVALVITQPNEGSRADAPADPAVEQIWQDYWLPLLTENGAVSVEAIKRELFDYRTALREVGQVYYELTNGQFTKLNTEAMYILGAVEEGMRNAIAEAIDDRNPIDVLMEFGSAYHRFVNQTVTSDDFKGAVIHALERLGASETLEPMVEQPGVAPADPRHVVIPAKENWKP